jgi:hypothetical protein
MQPLAYNWSTPNLQHPVGTPAAATPQTGLRAASAPSSDVRTAAKSAPKAFGSDVSFAWEGSMGDWLEQEFS